MIKYWYPLSILISFSSSWLFPLLHIQTALCIGRLPAPRITLLLGQTGVPKKTHKPHITWQIMKHSGDRFLQINLTAYRFFGVSCFSCICSVARSQKFYTSVQMKAVMWTVKCLWGRRGSLLDPLVCFTPEAALQYWILNWVQIWKAMVFGCEHVLFIM